MWYVFESHNSVFPLIIYSCPSDYSVCAGKEMAFFSLWKNRKKSNKVKSVFIWKPQFIFIPGTESKGFILHNRGVTMLAIDHLENQQTLFFNKKIADICNFINSAISTKFCQIVKLLS